eukprot:jgi/Botrbrau1/15976/Bobra.0375s0003.1
MQYNQRRSRIFKAAKSMLRAGMKHLQGNEAQGRAAIIAMHPDGPDAALEEEAKHPAPQASNRRSRASIGTANGTRKGPSAILGSEVKVPTMLHSASHLQNAVRLGPTRSTSVLQNPAIARLNARPESFGQAAQVFEPTMNINMQALDLMYEAGSNDGYWSLSDEDGCDLQCGTLPHRSQAVVLQSLTGQQPSNQLFTVAVRGEQEQSLPHPAESQQKRRRLSESAAIMTYCEIRYRHTNEARVEAQARRERWATSQELQLRMQMSNSVSASTMIQSSEPDITSSSVPTDGPAAATNLHSVPSNQTTPTQCPVLRPQSPFAAVDPLVGPQQIADNPSGIKLQSDAWPWQQSGTEKRPGVENVPSQSLASPTGVPCEGDAQLGQDGLMSANCSPAGIRGQRVGAPRLGDPPAHISALDAKSQREDIQEDWDHRKALTWRRRPIDYDLTFPHILQHHMLGGLAGFPSQVTHVEVDDVELNTYSGCLISAINYLENALEQLKVEFQEPDAPSKAVKKAVRKAAKDAGVLRSKGSGLRRNVPQRMISQRSQADSRSKGKRLYGRGGDLGDFVMGGTGSLHQPKLVERIPPSNIAVPSVKPLSKEEVSNRVQAITYLRENSHLPTELLSTLGMGGGDSSEEQTSDEMYLEKHELQNEAENQRALLAAGGGSQKRNPSQTKPKPQRSTSLSTRIERMNIHESPMTVKSAPSNSANISSEYCISHVPSAPSISTLAPLDTTYPAGQADLCPAQPSLLDDGTAVAAKKRGRPRGSSRSNKAASRRSDQGKAGRQSGKMRASARGSQLAAAESDPGSSLPPTSPGQLQASPAVWDGPEQGQSLDPEQGQCTMVPSQDQDSEAPQQDLPELPDNTIVCDTSTEGQRPLPQGAAPGG